jgi:TRAP-type C4-dicarboxylate transport system permease small subunit
MPPSSGRADGTLLLLVGGVRRAVVRLARFLAHAAGWGFVLCSVFITSDVVTRSAFGFSSQATTEITGYMLAFGISWALAHTLAERAHIRVDVLINKLPLGLRQHLHLLALLLLAIFVGFAAWRAVELVAESILFDAVDTSAMKIPLVLPQGLWAFGVCVLALLIALMLVEVVLLLIAGRGEEVERLLGARTIDDEAEEALEAVAMAHEREQAARS